MRLHSLILLLVALMLLLAAPTALAGDQFFLIDSLAERAPEAAERAQARALQEIFDRLATQSQVDATLVYSTKAEINAFATEVGDQRLVVIHEGLLSRLDGDRDAVAAVIGHELAHHKADHIRAGRRKQKGMRLFGALLGAVVSAKVGRSSGQLAGSLSGSVVNIGANLVAMKFSRNQEMQADRLSLGWMIAAGYSPNGMLRLQERLAEFSSTQRSAAILSTHPSSRKRYRAAESWIARAQPPTDLLVAPPVALVSAGLLAEVEAEVTPDLARRALLASLRATSDQSQRDDATTASLIPEQTSNVHIGSHVRTGHGVRIGTSRNRSDQH